MEKKGIIGQKCVLCPPLFGESLSFCASSNRAMSLFGIFKVQNFRERLFSSFQFFKKKFFFQKFEFSEFFFQKKLGLEIFPDFFFGKFSQNIKSRARSLVEGRHSVVLSLLRPKDDEETKPYIYKYIHIHIHRGFFRFRPWPHEKKQK